MPSAVSFCSTTSAGRGVILSIMLQGKETFASSSSHATNSAGTKPRFSHSRAISVTPAFSFSPLWEQLSMLTTATGVPPALKRSSSSAATTPIACFGAAGPASMSAAATRVSSPFMSRSA